MSFELKVADARPLKALIAAVGEFADQAILEIHTEAVNLAVMDPSRSVLVHFKVPKAMFDDYTTKFGDDSSAVFLPLSFEYLQQIFSTAQEEPVQLQDGEAALRIYFPGPPERRFTMPLLDQEGLEIAQNYLNIELPYQCTIEADTFQRMVKTLGKVGGVVKFHMKNQDLNILTLITQGDGVSLAEITLQSEQFPLEGSLTGPAQEMVAEYTLKWLQDIMKHAGKLGENVSIAFGDKLPLALNIVLENGGELGYILAPRIEEA